MSYKAALLILARRKSYDVVHQVQLTEESLLAKITGKRSLGVNSTHHQAVASETGAFVKACLAK